jgi:hypothetical protein
MRNNEEHKDVILNYYTNSYNSSLLLISECNSIVFIHCDSINDRRIVD